MANPTINQQINFDASVNLDSASQRRFEQQLGGGFFKRLETAAKKAGSLLAAPMRAAGRATANVPKVKVNTGVGDAAKKDAAALGFSIKKPSAEKRTTRGGGGGGAGGGAEGSSASTVVKNAMKAFRQSVQQIVKLVTTAIKATTQQVQKIAQAVKRMILSTKSRGRDPNDPAVKAENKAQAEAAKDPVGGSTTPQHVIVDNGKIEVTNQPPSQSRTPPTPPSPTPPQGDDEDARKRTVIEFDPTKIIQMVMNIIDRAANIAKAATAGPVQLTGKYATVLGGFTKAVELGEALGITTNEAAAKMNEALSAGVELGESIYGSMENVIGVSEYLGIGISELLSNSRKMQRNFHGSFDLAAAASGMGDQLLMTTQEAYSVVTAAVSAIGKSGMSASAMVGRTATMIKAFGDEIGPAMAQMQEVFRGQSLGDTIKEIMLMGTDNARRVLNKAMVGLGDDKFAQDTKAMITKALASGDLVAMAEALQLIGPAAEDLAQTVRGQKLGVGFRSGGLGQLVYRAVTGMGAQDVQDVRVKQAADVLGAVGDAPMGGIGGAGAVRTAREPLLSYTETIQKRLDEVLAAFASSADPAATAMDAVAAAGQAAAAAIRAMLPRWAGGTGSGDPIGDARRASQNNPILDIIFGGVVNDFIYRGDGTTGKITPINTRDQFFGAKPGGAIDRAIASAATGMGMRSGRTGGRPTAGPTNITVNINGGDLGKVYEVVRTVLQQSGIRPPAGAYAT